MQRDLAIILGKTGYGKSTWLMNFCKGYKRIFVFDPFAKFPAQYLDDQALCEAHERGDFSDDKEFCVGSYRLNDLELLGAFSFMHGKCILVIEECGFVFNKGERIPEWLSEIVFLGRHQQTSIAITAQAPVYIPIDLRSQAHRLISFWLTETRDLDWTEQYFGDRVEEILTLPKFECLDADDRIVTRYKVFP